MFKRIQIWFDNRRFKKEFDRIDKTISNLKFSPAATGPTQQLFAITGQDEIEDSLMFTGNNGDEIFSISSNGEAKWLKEDSYNEAAEMFLTYMTMNIEDKAGIAQNRIEWEERITAKLTEQAEIAPLGPQELTDLIRKCIMYDKLKGTKN